MKIEDVIDHRFEIALGKAGVVGMRPRRSQRGHPEHRYANGTIACDRCGHTANAVSFGYSHYVDGATCPACGTFGDVYNENGSVLSRALSREELDRYILR